MKFTETPLAGAFIVDLEPHADERGFFARTFCVEEFARFGFDTLALQCSVSFNIAKGTLRGMHYQAPPYEEEKIVRCTAGSVFDVIVDVRRASPAYGRWFGIELTSTNRRALFAPKGFAHGFLTLSDASEISYMISAQHAPQAGRGFLWNDPRVGIAWPLQPTVISARDAGYQSLSHDSA